MSQLLLYIWGKYKVGKSRIVNAIKLRFSLFFYKADFVLAAPIGAAISNIEGNIIHICLEIGVKNNQEKTNKVSNIWT